MEAVPKLPMISFEVKTSPENTHFGPKLKLYIAEGYREDPESYSNEIHQLECLRSAAVRPTMDAAGLKGIIRYFCQLRAIQSRFPMGKGQPAACSFSWKDLYATMTCSLADIKFEMACILYNIGAMNTEIAALEPRTTADSLKAACTHYQNAAYTFQLVREQFPQPPGVDVCSDILRVHQEICLAQAQECILEKSIQDSRKPTVIGAVAAQVIVLYKNAIALLGPSTGSDSIHETIGTRLYNYWYRMMSFKLSYIGCIVCLYQGMHAEEQQKMGERVAFYQLAVDKLAEARKLVKYVEPVQPAMEALTFTNDVVEGKRKAAKNENEFIYHEGVPDKDLLTDMKPVCLVKPLPINFSDPEISGPDIFARLVPMGAHEASSMYSEEKAKLLRHMMSQVDAKNNELTEFLSSLQLDQLDVLDSEQNIPQDIVDRCASMNAKTGVIQTLVDSMNNLAEIISDVEHSLDDIKSLIQEETQKEKDFQKSMGPRPPSIVQTELSREFHKYQEAHSRTTDSNQVLHKAMTLHIANLQLLAQPLDVLKEKIPSIDNIEGLDRATMCETRRVVRRAGDMRLQREALLQALREELNSDDVTGRLLAGAAPADEVFKQELDKHTPKVKLIEQNLAAQENILNRLTSLYASYGDSRRLLAEVLRKRDGLINALITSYDTYEELLGKSHKGIEFYKKLSHNVNQLLSRLKSTCQVQEEERAQLLAKQTRKSSTPTPSVSPGPAGKVPDLSGVPSASGSRKLKDYLPYMKTSRMLPKTPQALREPVSQEAYYPETMYPTSARPAPVGSEATDPTQMQLPDGVVMPQVTPNPYERYPTPQGSEISYDAYGQNYAMPATSKPYEKQDYPYNPYAQYPSNVDAQAQMYTNPYYNTPQASVTSIPDPQPPMSYASNIPPNSNNQFPVYSDQYAQNIHPVAPTASSTQMPTDQYGNPDLNVNFAQMQITGPKVEPVVTDYSQTYYSPYPQTSTPSVSTYSQSFNPNNVAAVSSMPSDYNSVGYQYSVNTPYSTQEQFSYATSNLSNVSQTYPTYTNAVSSVTSSTNINNTVTSQPYAFQAEAGTYNQTLPQLDTFDQPIKSHVTGEALSSPASYGTQNMSAGIQNPTNTDQTYQNNSNVAVQNTTGVVYQPPNSYTPSDQTNVNYTQNYQNHPGYMFNPATGNYEYAYGSQNSYTNVGNVDPQMNKDGNWAGQLYTSAGTYETVQSPSEGTQQFPPQNQPENNAYYNTPYGYLTTTNQSSEVVVNTQACPTNYGANMNQSTYMQSGQGHDTSVTFTKEQVSSPVESVQQPTEQNSVTTIPSTQTEQCAQSSDIAVSQAAPQVETPVENTPEPKEPSVFDLLSDIDFTVEQKPLMPEIKVPQISENAIMKLKVPKVEPVPAPKEEVLERPAKRDLFSDPSLLNTFTQEVKKLQNLVDSLTNKMPGGLTLLDAKWKSFQDAQAKENMSRSKSKAMEHSTGSIISEVVPYDDSRVTLQSDPDAYINASYYKQLASWCIPLVISNNPSENEYGIFWKAVLENKISCVVCLLSEIEMQGTAYWPTAKGQSLELSGGLKVTLDDVTCTVHWTERKLSVTSGKTILNVTHYQINVFPAKIVCAPLVLLVDRVLSVTYDGRASGAWLQGGAGPGRAALLALLLMLVCQVRAGQLHLCDMLDAGCVNLCKNRTNILEDTKYLADAYRTALFYVQGVLCSGTTMFNGEAVSVPSGAAVLPPVTPTPAPSTTTASVKKNKFSRESFEEMKQAPGLKSGDMKDPLNFLDPLWSLKKK